MRLFIQRNARALQPLLHARLQGVLSQILAGEFLIEGIHYYVDGVESAKSRAFEGRVIGAINRVRQ